VINPSRLPQIDETRCLGYGECADTAPDVFVIGDDGISRLRSDFDPATLDERAGAVLEAVDRCPTQSISFELS
jgi:ferredoxin